jgi:GNAT superfamily N-acetyltransferase
MVAMILTRKCTPLDLPAVGHLQEQWHRDFEEYQPWPTDWLALHCANDSIFFHVAVDDGKIVGFIIGNQVAKLDIQGDLPSPCFEVLDVYSTLDGAGTLLLTDFRRWARDHGAASWAAFMLSNNLEGLSRFYERFAMKRDGDCMRGILL